MAVALDHSIDDDDSTVDYDDLSDLAPGFRFEPTDQELLGYYLRRKTTGRGLPPDVDAAIPTLELFGPRASPPWLIHPCGTTASSSLHGNRNHRGIASCDAPRDLTDWFYCFASATPWGPGACLATESGTWVSNGGEERVGRRGENLGYKRTFAFRILRGGGGGANSKAVGTGWVMHEFRTHHQRKAAAKTSNISGSSSYDDPPSDAAVELVLCRMRCTKRMASQLTDEGAMASRVKRQKRTGTGTGASLDHDGDEGGPGGQQSTTPSFLASRIHAGAVPLAAWTAPPVPHNDGALEQSPTIGRQPSVPRASVAAQPPLPPPPPPPSAAALREQYPPPLSPDSTEPAAPAARVSLRGPHHRRRSPRLPPPPSPSPSASPVVRIQLGQGSAAYVTDPAMGGSRRQAAATGRVKGSGRRRIPMAKIAGLQTRRVCFAKRRQGLFRRCADLCQLFPGYQIAAVAFSPDVGTSFGFNAPSSSSSPVDLFRRLLSEISSMEDPMERIVEDDGAHHRISGLSSSSFSATTTTTNTTNTSTTTTTSLNNRLLQTLLDEEERAELEAALQWADGILEVGDGSFVF